MLILVSIAIHLLAISYTVRFMLRTRNIMTASLMLTMITLHGFKRVVYLNWIFNGAAERVDAFGELVGIVIAVIMLFGVVIIARLTEAGTVTRRKLLRDNGRINSAYKISQQMHHISLTTLLDSALEEAIRLVDSVYGYIYYYDEDTRRFTLHSWSKNVMAACTIPNPQNIYDLDKTGIWGEAVRQRKPIIVNDYHADNPLKKGYPEGHARLFRFMTVPVLSEGRIVAVVGAANKISEYTDEDVAELTMFMDSVWGIAARFQAEEAMRKSEALYHDLVETSQDLIWQCDAEGRYVYLNRAWEDVFGYKLDHMLGRKFTDFQKPLNAEFDKKVFEVLLAGGTVRGHETVHIASDGHDINLVFNAKPIIDGAGVMVGTRGTAYDITLRKVAEDRLRRSLAEKDVLIKEIHHRVKNNLIVIQSLLKLQQRSVHGDEQASAMLLESHNRVQSMSMIHEMLYQSPDLKSVRLTDYLRSMTARLFNAYRKVDAEIALELALEDISLDVDTLIPLGLIVNELVSNALKYAFPEGRGRLLITLKHAPDGEGVVLSVKDNGVGLGPEFKLDGTSTLGMRIVSSLSKQIQGRVQINQDGGTEFRIEFKK